MTVRSSAVHQQRRPPVGLPVADRLALGASRAGDDDEPGIGTSAFGCGHLVEGSAYVAQLLLALRGVQAAHEVAGATARCVEVEEVGLLLPGHGERVHHSGRNEDPGLGADHVLAVLEPERELAGEEEERLRVSLVDVGRRSDAAGRRADVDHAELLDVRQERDSEPAVAGDVLAVRYSGEDRLHGTAA